MLILLFIIFFLKISISNQINSFPNDYLGELTYNLIENLRVDPYLIGVSRLSDLPETAKEFIDKHTEQYSELVLTSQQREYSRSKRSFLDGSENDVQNNIVDLSPYYLSIKTPWNDITIFRQNSTTYVVILNYRESQNGSNLMIIMKNQGDAFEAVIEKEIQNGVRIAAFSLERSTLIIVAQDNNITKIFEFDNNEKLDILETIQNDGRKDVAIWEDNGNVFMSLVGFMGNSSSYFPRLYKWRGRHFDDLQDIRSGATRISPFMIGSLGFLAVAYDVSDNSEENENVYSEILKYNVNTEKYELFEKILTYACDDIRYFEIDTVGEKGESDKERFLAVANSYKKDSYGNMTEKASSIIYKFVDNYFYPFQCVTSDGVFQWEIVKNEHGDILLLALTRGGIKTFQYDGWLFVETAVKFQEKLSSDENLLDIKMIRKFVVSDDQLLVLARASASKNKPSIFRINFSRKDKLKELHDQLLTWCQEKIHLMSEQYKISREAPENNATLELQRESQKQILNLESFGSTINSQNSELSTIENTLKNHQNGVNFFEKDINATLLLLNTTATLESLFSDEINRINVSKFLENKIDINDEIDIDTKIRADVVQTKATVVLNYFNNHSSNNFIYTTEARDFKNMIINGNVVFNDSVVIINTLNDINITKETILLKSGDQNLRDLKVSHIVANRLKAGAINGKNIEVTEKARQGSDAGISSDPEDPNDNIPEKKVQRFKEVKVRNLIVGGFINDVDIPTLEKYALKISGNQNITQTYYIDKVETKRVDTKRISGRKVPGDLITINNGNIRIPKLVKFNQPVTVENLQVKDFLNTIPVNKQGDLEILFKQPSDQRVTALKSFDYLNLLHPIEIQEKIRSAYFDSINPRKTISSNLIINKNITITGNVTVQNILRAKDIVSKITQTNETVGKMGIPASSGDTTQMKNDFAAAADSVSLARVVKQGIMLNDTNFTVPLRFLKDVSTNRVYTNLINNLDPSKFVIVNSDNPVKITGNKTFTGNLSILGNIDVKQINGITAFDMEKNVLKTVSNQLLTGQYYIKNVTIKGSLKSNSTHLGKHLWKNVVTQNDVQNLEGNWTLTDLIANSTTIKHVFVQGLINGMNFTEFLEDAVPTDEESKILGSKSFQTLNVTNLWINNDFDSNKRVKDVVDGNIVLQNVGKIDSISAENVYFQNSCNGMGKSEFENTSSFDNNGVLIVDDESEFEKIIVMGTVFVDDNKLDDVDMDDLELDTAKVDEPAYFENADFGKSLVVKPKIIHYGQIENLDLDNVMENGKNQTQIIMNKIIFKGDVFVNGTVKIESRINNNNISDLCGVLSKLKTPKKIVIEGNVHFAKGPRIRKFNERNATHLEKNIWFTDDPATLSGNIAFNNNVTLRDILTVEGLLNDVHLGGLFNNYLSKTKDQTVVAHINLLNKTVFKEDVTSPMVSVDGTVNGVKLEKFLKNTLLHRSQLFEDMLYFEEVSVQHLEGNYLVNKLNLDSEVMRYDRPNLITGAKKFENLDVDVLRPERETTLKGGAAKVQGVDVQQWLQNAVLNKGSFKIGGKKIFRAIEANEGTSVMGHFNGIKFDADTTMVRHADQNITGKKTFMLNFPSEVRFKAMKIKGLVNGEHLEKVLSNRAYKNNDNTFTTNMQFSNNISTKNVQFQTKISGMDVSELLRNISTLGTLHHIKEKYQILNDMANQVESALKGQAFFLDYYKPVFMVFGVDELFSMKCFGSGKNIISFTNEKGANIIRFLEWNEKQEIFKNISIDGNTDSYPSYITKITMGNVDRIYLERPTVLDGDSDTTHTGQFMVCNNKNLEFTPVPFLTKGTRFLTSFEMKSLKTWCLLFVDYNFDINILCRRKNEQFRQVQIIKNPSPVMAYIVTIHDTPMLVTLHMGNDKRTVFWILNNGKFEDFQTIREGEPIGVSAVSTEKDTFLAVAYRHMPNTKDFGKVVIRRIKNLSKSVSIFQTIPISTPTKVELDLLPSKEIALYVITENPSEPLTVYLYKGVQGFVKKIGKPTIPVMKDINIFSFNNKHFVVLKNDVEVNVLQAVFKGSKFD